MKTSTTSRVEFEKKIILLTTALEAAANGIVITDTNGIVQWVNPAFSSLTGYSFGEIVGKSTSILKSGKQNREFYKILWESISAGNVWRGEMIDKRKDGSFYTEEQTIAPVKYDNGEIIAYIGIQQDITERKRLESELVKRAAELEKLYKTQLEIDNEKSQFVSLASHQLRTPLGAIKWSIEAVKLNNDFDKFPESIKSHIEDVYTSNERLIGLVGDLLDISKIEQGLEKNSPEKINPDLLIKEILEELKVLSDLRKISINYKYQGVQEFIIDKKRFREVLENLIANAIKYSKENNEVLIDVEIQSSDLIINITDSGIGIPEASKDRIFNKFYRAPNAATTNSEGSGLGLYIVKAYVENMDGRVWFESTENKGTTFHIKFPINQV